MPKGRDICAECEEEFSYVQEPYCLCCGKEIAQEEKEYCATCQGKTFAFDSCVALMSYDQLAADSLAKFKYGARPEYANFYARALIERRGDDLRRMNPQLIVPVPVHASRLRERGYNQAQVLAEGLGKGLGIPVRDDILIRTRKTIAQKELGAASREKNLSQAIEVTMPLTGVKRVLVVDDIYTTGSTMQVCAKALRKAGVQTVYGCVVAVSREGQ